MKQLPLILTITRILLAPVIVFFASKGFSVWMIITVIVAITTDIFDGIIARKLNVSTPFLRKFDTIADRIFFISALAAGTVLCPAFFEANAYKIFILFGIELFSHLISYVRFQKIASTHNLLSKLWGIFFVASLIDIYLDCDSSYLFNLCMITGGLARLESCVIMLILRKWDCDIPGVWHAIQLRKGIRIKRRTLLNS